MTKFSRRSFLKFGATATATMLLPPAIRDALSIQAYTKLGTIEDVQHVVILMQENRAFDHYFGTLHGVRGFGDPHPLPVPDTLNFSGKTVWSQRDQTITPTGFTLPFHLDTKADAALIRTIGAHHAWADAQAAWNNGAIHSWPTYKGSQSMGYFSEQDIPFQFALANAFTICDAYHCSFHGSTVPNRHFLWSGTNDPLQKGHGPVLANQYGTIDGGDPDGGYSWTSYPERLEKAGISWHIYDAMTDNFPLNPLVGYRQYREALKGTSGSSAALKCKALSARNLAQLRQDVLNDQLPQVAWIIAPQESSEHPGPSSPAQGADYTAQVISALIANPTVWSKTVLFLMFDENDGFFDHMPPPSVPSPRVHLEGGSTYAGASNIDTKGEYHLNKSTDEADLAHPEYMGRPYGMGPRVPMYVISPWSKGGWVNSEVFDHTSVIRFLEQRFGVMEPNISPWRRAVAGDLTSAFNFAAPERAPFPAMPATAAGAKQATSFVTTKTPAVPKKQVLPTQAVGARPSRALPYTLDASIKPTAAHNKLVLALSNKGKAAAVFHVYDLLNLEEGPSRYTLAHGTDMDVIVQQIAPGQKYNLWILGPGGFHRQLGGRLAPQGANSGRDPEITVQYDVAESLLRVAIKNAGQQLLTFSTCAIAHSKQSESKFILAPEECTKLSWDVKPYGNWYDVVITSPTRPDYVCRMSGRIENGHDLTSDPAMGGMALLAQWTPKII